MLQESERERGKEAHVRHTTSLPPPLSSLQCYDDGLRLCLCASQFSSVEPAVFSFAIRHRLMSHAVPVFYCSDDDDEDDH